MANHKHSSSIFIQRVPIFKGVDKVLLNGIQLLAREHNITVPQSIHIFTPNPSDPDCIAFVHIQDKNECYAMVSILKNRNFNGVKIKASVNKFYVFEQCNDAGVESGAKPKGPVESSEEKVKRK